MEPAAIKKYRQLRGAGYRSPHALDAAKTWSEFDAAGDVVRITITEETDGYFDVYGEPEGYTDVHGRRVTPEAERAEIVDLIDRLGCWIVSGEYWSETTGKWVPADSVGMCTGYTFPDDPKENPYIPDLMRSALNALAKDRQTAAHAETMREYARGAIDPEDTQIDPAGMPEHVDGGFWIPARVFIEWEGGAG